ncbi:MAG: glycoside hydrolase family 16 protein [bacterium]
MLSGIATRRAMCALVISAALACRAPSAEPGAPSEVIFFDDFSASSLDRAHWTVRTTGPTYNEEQQAYVDDGTTIRLVSGAQAMGASNGALEIRGRSRPGFVTPQAKRFDFVSGRLDTRAKMEFTYGTAAARMRLPDGPGLWPAFWVLGAGPWPATGEIDVMENVGDASWVSAAMHGPGYSGDTPLVKRAPFPDGESATGWHVYSVDWTPQQLVFRIDARETYRVTRPMVEKYGRWAFDQPKHLILNLALGGGYPRSVNGARGEYAGLPDATVRLIQSDSVRVLVDWVRVTR